MDALILVDLQNDFMPGGALAVAEGDSIVPAANRLCGEFELVVATRDWHPADHGSFASNNPGAVVGEVGELDGLPQVMWPDHCVQGTRGADFHADLDTSAIDAVFVKGTDRRVDSYSGFHDNGRRHSTGLADYLRQRSVDAVWVLGLATDYCVKFTALAAVEEGFETHLVLDACRGVELAPGDTRAAVEAMREAGVHVTTAEAARGR